MLVAVKSHQTAAVMHDVARSTPPDVTLVSAQNGVANEAVLLRCRTHVVGRKLMMNLGNAADAACAPGPDRDELVDLAQAEGESVLAAAGRPGRVYGGARVTWRPTT